MFLKKNIENIVYIFTFFVITFFIIFSKNSLYSYWTDIFDQDVTLIYNSLLIASGANQQYLDHPAHTTFFLLNVLYKIGYFLNIIDFKDINGLLNHPDKYVALQNLHNLSQSLHIFYSILLTILLKKIIYTFTNNNLSAFFLSLIFLISPANIFLLDRIRSEILSLICIFLFYISLENSLKKNIKYIFLSGLFFILALLAKVQVILCLGPLLFIFFMKNESIESLNKIFVSRKTEIILNIILIFFIFYIMNNFFYKRIDKIFFFIIFISMVFIFTKIEVNLFNSKYSNTVLIMFFGGCFGCILLFKFFDIIGFSGFHPELMKIITSPISVMTSISTRYTIGTADGFEYIFKIKEFFLQLVSNDRFSSKWIEYFLLNKFNIFTYSISLIFICLFLIKKNYKKLLTLLGLTILNFCIILIFYFRPYSFYDVYVLPFNIILFAILIKDYKFKKNLAFLILIIYIFFNYSNINERLNEKRFGGILNTNQNSIDNKIIDICKHESIMDKKSYIRYWHRKYDEKFLKEMCKSYFIE